MTRRFTAALGITLGLLSLAMAHAIARAPLAAELASVPQRLSETGLYKDGDDAWIDQRNRPFSPQYPLWTDGATKRRWIYLPPDTAIDISNIDAWEFPTGTRLWKEFAFDGRKVETRMLWKAAVDRWLAVTYVWNADQTDAELAPADGIRQAYALAPARWHGIPSQADCAACHGARHEPLGFSALQLSTDRDPNAIHGEPLAPDMVTLQSLTQDGLLQPARVDLIATPPRIQMDRPLTRAVLGYLSANCGACHNNSGEIAANLPSLAYSDVMRNPDAVVRGLIGRRTRWQVPGHDATLAIDVDHPRRSAVLARLSSRRPSSQMPPLGTALADTAALAALEKWIATELAAIR